MPPPVRDLTFTPLTSDRTDLARGLRGNRSDVPVSLIIDNSCRVHIAHIPLSCIERDGANALRAEFEAFGPVESYKMFTERSGRFIGSVLCTYRNPADASMAVYNMDGRVIDDSTLKVTLSRDHGVVLLHQTVAKHPHGFTDDNKEEAADGKWQHDRYQDILNGNIDLEDEDVFGRRRGGRGRRGGGMGGPRGRGKSVEEAFEEYIMARDKLLDAAEGVPDSKSTGKEEETNAVPAVDVDPVATTIESAAQEVPLPVPLELNGGE